MPSKSSLYQRVILFSFSTLALALNPTWAKKDTDYINALDDEAKITSMQDEKPVPEPAPEPAVMPDESTDIKKLTYQTTQKLQQVLGVSNTTDDKKTSVDNELVKMVSSALEQGHSLDNIRSALSEAMASLIAQPGQTITTETLESVSNALTQIVGEINNVAADNPKDNYIRSLNKQLTEQSVMTPKPKKQVGPERTVTVLKGESLTEIAKRVYGSHRYYTLLYNANRDTITNPDVIRVGQVLKVPEFPKH